MSSAERRAYLRYNVSILFTLVITSGLNNSKTPEIMYILSYVLAVLVLDESQFSIRFSFVGVDVE